MKKQNQLTENKKSNIDNCIISKSLTTILLFIKDSI